MAKDPAFLFYPNDWIGGTMGMSFEEKGAYIELLMMQFNRGHMTTHMIGQVVGQIWDKIKHKFIQDEQGNWFNERLELEKEKRKNFTKSRRNNISGNNQHKKQKNNVAHMDGHMTTHMENENENVNENIIILKGKKFLNTDFQFLPENYIITITEQMFILKQQRIEENQINHLWEAFKLDNLTGEKYYNSEKEVYQHFVNWIKTQKFEKNETRTHAEKRTDAIREFITRFD
jgi:uncharacterized protein YdaU (DUF1376 family)